MFVSKVSFTVLVTILSVVAVVTTMAPATATATENLTLFPEAQVTTEVHPKAGIDMYRDVHDFNTDAVRIADAQKLRGRMWVRWALQWNREQYQRAQRDLRIETRTGTRITRQGNTTLITPYVSTSSYGSGPVLLFNPFVEPIQPIPITKAP